MQKAALIIFLTGWLTPAAFAQLIVVPIQKSPGKTVRHTTARQQLSPVPLPFWDDFSFSNSRFYPHDSLWQNGKSVSLNFGIGINPPSLGAVTMDGLDSLGKPYDVTNALAKGYADSLVSRPISLDVVPAILRNTVFLSFYYQFTGNGEVPDAGDHLLVDFRNDQGDWENAVTIEANISLDDSTFYPVVLPISGDRFFHNVFQFRFRNFGRLSGPYDTWNVDYVYLNSGRTAADTSYPDRTITTPLSNLFGPYSAIPVKHFANSNAPVIEPPSLSLHNLENIPGNTSQLDVQPISYDTRDSIIVYHKDSLPFVTTHTLDVAQSIGDPLQPLEFRKFSLNQVPTLAAIDTLTDSVTVYLKLKINTGDNVLPSPADPKGDYSLQYSPIDFRLNDVIQSETKLTNYYAYDDGSAEYGIGLNQPGAQVAYYFEMKTPDPDAIVAVDIYFPRFGDESSQILLLRILSDLTDNQQSVLYEENIGVSRSAQNKFIRFPLSRNSVIVQGSFYVGWKQSSAINIPVGWDKNTDSGDKIYFNTNGAWEQNRIERGSMMVRPVFGKGVIMGLPGEGITFQAFPNPNNGTFYLSGGPEHIDVFDLTGKSVGFSREDEAEQTKIIMHNASPGLYVVKTFNNNKITTQKIMVRP